MALETSVNICPHAEKDARGGASKGKNMNDPIPNMHDFSFRKCLVENATTGIHLTEIYTKKE